jgi:hypothetical protein
MLSASIRCSRRQISARIAKIQCFAMEAALLREISQGRDSAAHFRVVGLLGRGAFGCVLKVRHAAVWWLHLSVWMGARCACRVQVRCTHPRHPNPGKHYALKLVINYANVSRSASVARRYGLDCVVLRRLPQRHPNLCKLLAEFTSAVPDEMFELLTQVL